MKNIIKLGVISLFLITITSCNKDLAIDINPLYIANWEADDGEATYDIDIDIWGYAEYTKVKGGTTTESSGRAKVKDDKLHIGFVKFDIDQAPNYNAQNELVMILDGVTYMAY